MRIQFNNSLNVTAGISERSDGSMVWWNRKPVNETVCNNRDRFFVTQRIDPSRVVTGGTVHGTTVAVVDEKAGGQYLLDTDALITQTPNLFLTITAADCMPIYFYDPVTQSVGIAHAGWRGLVAGILESVTSEMNRVFHVVPNNLNIVIGPHIRVCHFEVSDDVAIRFDSSNVERRDNSLFVSLADEAMHRLRGVGVERITSNTVCTHCHVDQFFSARHDRMEPLLGMLGYIGLRP